jgi:hypothetical protein
MDKKRLIGETEHVITKNEIDAWNRGKGDVLASKLLAASKTVSVKQAVALVKMWAELGDIHYLSTRFDIDVGEIRKVLAAFGVHSIEDAKEAVRSGVIAEYDNAAATNREEAELDRTVDQAEGQKRLEAFEEAKKVEVKTEEEKDVDLAERREVAIRKNKEDQIREFIADEMALKSNSSGFRIPLGQVGRFKQMIPYGVSQLQRQFGGSANDILGEIKRLAPSIDVDMLRR